MKDDLGGEDISPQEYTNLANNVERGTLETASSSAASSFLSSYHALGRIAQKSGFNNLSFLGLPTEAPLIALQGATRGLSESEGLEENMLRKLSVDSSTPNMGWGQWTGNQIGSMIGMMGSPVDWMGGNVLGMAAKGALDVGERIAPNFVKNALTKKFPELLGMKLPGKLSQESLSSLGSRGLVGFSELSGGSVPQAISDNYDKNTNNIHWGGVAKESAQMGGFGIAMGALGFTAGTIFKKIAGVFKTPAPGEVPAEVMNKAEQALKNGTLSPEEYKWAQDYSENPNDPTINPRASSILGKQGHDVDYANHTVNMEILTGDDVRNQQSATADQLGSGVPKDIKSVLSDFINHNAIDNLNDKMSNDPNFKNGVQGYIDFITNKLEKKPEEMQSIEDVTSKYMKSNISKDHPYSQQSIYKAIKKNPNENIQIQVPKEVDEKIRSEKYIKNIKKSINETSKLHDQSTTENDKNYYKGIIDSKKTLLSELSSRIEKLKSPKEEVSHLQEKLMPEGEPKNGYEGTPEYRRLQDLAPVSSDAKGLLYKLHIANEYKRQEAFITILDTLNKINDAPIGKLANSQNVAKYLKEKIDGKLAKQEIPDIKQTKERVSNMNREPSDIEGHLSDQRSDVMESDSKYLKDQFKTQEKRINQFKDSSSILDTMMKCVKGIVNV